MFNLRRWSGIDDSRPVLALEIRGEDDKPPPFGTLFKPGGPEHRRGLFPLPKEYQGSSESTNVLIKTILDRHPLTSRAIPWMSTLSAGVFEPQPPTNPELTQQGSHVEEEVPKDPSYSPSDQIAGEGKTTAATRTVDQCADGPAETRQVKDMDTTSMDLSGGTSNPIPDNTPQSDPTSKPSTNSKPKPKSAFIKIMELDEKDMLMAWMEAFFGETLDIQRRSCVSDASYIPRTDHYFFVERSGGDLHGDISPNTLIYLEEQKKGGLLHLDPPVRMPGGDFKFSL